MELFKLLKNLDLATFKGTHKRKAACHEVTRRNFTSIWVFYPWLTFPIAEALAYDNYNTKFIVSLNCHLKILKFIIMI